MKNQDRLAPLPENWEKALAVVAHPDDLEYGAASAIARWTSQGKTVDYLLATRGEAGIDGMDPDETGRIRSHEEKEGAEIVGVQKVDFLAYPDGVIEYGLPLRRDIARAIRKNRPDLLITLNHHLTFGRTIFNMADHRAVAMAAMDAARDAGNRWIFPELIREGLNPWNNVKRICVSGSPNPTHAVDVTSFIDKGIASLQKHRVYIQNLPGRFDPDEFLRENASITGTRFGCKYAVDFEVIEV